MFHDMSTDFTWSASSVMTHLTFERGKRDHLETLHPAYFAMVMATGIVAIASEIHAVPVVPDLLLWLNVAFFVVALCGAGEAAPADRLGTSGFRAGLEPPAAAHELDLCLVCPYRPVAL